MQATWGLGHDSSKKCITKNQVPKIFITFVSLSRIFWDFLWYCKVVLKNFGPMFFDSENSFKFINAAHFGFEIGNNILLCSVMVT